MDYAYCIFSTKQLTQFPLCLQVWRAAHHYPIDGLRKEASLFALQYVTPKYMVEFVQHAELYGADQHHVRACSDLDENFVETAKQCPIFRELSCHQMLQTLLSEDLIGTEDELLCVVMKWVDCNPQAPMNEAEELYASIRMERVKTTGKMQELVASETSPPSLVRYCTRLCFQRLHTDIAMQTISGPISVDVERAKFVIRGEDAALGVQDIFFKG